MSTVVLILTMLLASGGSHVASVEGFSSVASCEAAGERWARDVKAGWPNDRNRAAIATCVTR